MAREALGINLEGQVVIIDEAHSMLCILYFYNQITMLSQI